jgi:hypothetical protein
VLALLGSLGLQPCRVGCVTTQESDTGALGFREALEANLLDRLLLRFRCHNYAYRLSWCNKYVSTFLKSLNIGSGFITCCSSCRYLRVPRYRSIHSAPALGLAPYQSWHLRHCKITLSIRNRERGYLPLGKIWDASRMELWTAIGPTQRLW